ncbi:MAG: hypothetical protein P0S94_01970, partial [Simkaniaceae bacterium]|nr:hypothetical protein [Simkaniaceae bacterium]
MKRLLLVMSFSVALHGNITWQQAEVVSEPLGSIFTSGNTVAVDAAGNAINAFTYQITTPFITVATIHTAQGTAWGDLTASINTDEEILDNVFPGA